MATSHAFQSATRIVTRQALLPSSRAPLCLGSLHPSIIPIGYLRGSQPCHCSITVLRTVALRQLLTWPLAIPCCSVSLTYQCALVPHTASAINSQRMLAWPLAMPSYVR